MIVNEMPGVVVRQVVVSISDDGHNTYVSSMLAMFSAPATPNAINVSTAVETISPIVPAPNISRLSVT